MPLGVPQAVGESLLCLLWDGSLPFCQETGSQQLAGGATGTPCRYLAGWWRELGVPLGLGGCCHPHRALGCPVSWLFLMASVCLPARALWGHWEGLHPDFSERSDERGGKSKFASEMKPQGQLT